MIGFDTFDRDEMKAPLAQSKASTAGTNPLLLSAVASIPGEGGADMNESGRN